MAICNISIGCLVSLVLMTADYVNPAFVNVTTPFGVIEGIKRYHTVPDGTRYQVGLFLGIPYAKSPVGSRRFQKPQLTLSPGAFFRAHLEGKACPQNVVMLNGWVPGPSDMSEDCLKLNVYLPVHSSCVASNNTTPSVPTEKCPKKAVMIWIHGGAYVIGQSRIYNAQRLASVGDIIVVTINYRLGPLGFLNTGDGVVRGNAGLWDQQAAIEWVKSNVESFGGDPNRVTLSGESAGGASAIYQLLYPGNKGKITRVAVSSGTALNPWAFSRGTTEKYTTRLAKRVGCGYDYLPGFSVERHLKMVRCLRSKPFEAIINNSNVGSLTETLFRAEWVPIVDGQFIKEMPSDIFNWPKSSENSSVSTSLSNGLQTADSMSTLQATGLLSDVDAMVGSNVDDGEVVAKITVRNLINTTTGIDFNYDDTLSPEIVEKYYFPQIITDRFGKMKPSLVTAFNEAYEESLNETRQLNDSKLSPRFEALREILESTTDYEFLMPAVQTIAAMAGAKQTTVSASTSTSNSRRHFLFQFNRKYPNLSRPEWNRNAAHGDDLPYIFGFPPSMILAFNITSGVEQREWNTSKTVMTYWANFVKSGNPNSPEKVPTAWLQFNEREMNYLQFSENMSSANSQKNLFPERVHFWRHQMNNVVQN